MDVFGKPTSIDSNIANNLGPLATLAGVWEGDKGLDVAPSKQGSVETAYRERVTFKPLGPVVNGAQVLYGLRYATVAWPLGQEDPFHEEVGYWLWDSQATQVMRCFIVPRAVVVNAGGTVDPKATTFTLAAEVGSETFGVMSSPFLDVAFKTVRYELIVNILGNEQWSYEEDTQLQIQGQPSLFHHTDKNILTKCS